MTSTASNAGERLTVQYGRDGARSTTGPEPPRTQPDNMQMTRASARDLVTEADRWTQRLCSSRPTVACRCGSPCSSGGLGVHGRTAPPPAGESIVGSLWTRRTRNASSIRSRSEMFGSQWSTAAASLLNVALPTLTVVALTRAPWLGAALCAYLVLGLVVIHRLRPACAWQLEPTHVQQPTVVSFDARHAVAATPAERAAHAGRKRRRTRMFNQRSKWHGRHTVQPNRGPIRGRVRHRRIDHRHSRGDHRPEREKAQPDESAIASAEGEQRRLRDLATTATRRTPPRSRT